MSIFDPADGLLLYHLSKLWHFIAASHLTFMSFSLMPFGIFVTCPLFFGHSVGAEECRWKQQCPDVVSTLLRKIEKEEAEAGLSKLS